MRLSGRRYRIDWLHLAFVLTLGAAMVAYLVDARSVSLRTNNLLMLQPAVVVGLVLGLVVLPQCFRRIEGPAPALSAGARRDLARVGAVAGAFVGFVLTMERVGFDVASWAFVAVALFVCGERNPLLLVLFPAAFAAAVVAAFRWILPFPFPTTVM